MQNPPILSTPTAAPESTGTAHAGSIAAGRALVFDACHVGVVLRAVLFVEVVLGVGALFEANSPPEWLARLALLTGGALPATLLWLIVACSLKRWLQRLPVAWQYTAGVLLGAVSGLYACALLALVGIAFDPPWLASAVAGALLAAMLVAALILRARGRAPAATAARLAELQSRIRPHFLFNTLNSAIALVRAEPAKAESLLEDLSDLFRQALAEHSESVTLAEEILLAQRYLAIEQVRFGPRLSVHWDLDPRANTARLPPLLLQPLLENAVRHGVEPSDLGGSVNVVTELRGGRVVVTITNTLPPADAPHRAAAGHGMALGNVRARLALLHDVEGEFRCGIGNGTYQVTLILPAPKNRPTQAPSTPNPSV